MQQYDSQAQILTQYYVSTVTQYEEWCWNRTVKYYQGVQSASAVSQCSQSVSQCASTVDYGTTTRKCIHVKINNHVQEVGFNLMVRYCAYNMFYVIARYLPNGQLVL